MEIVCYACGRGEFPENTIEAISHCQKINKDWRIEVDLQMTKDSEIILFHDKNLKRITDLNMEVIETPLSAIQKLNAGYNFLKEGHYPYRDDQLKIPSLKDVFFRFPATNFLLDVHTDNLRAIDKIIDIVEHASMEKNIVVVSKFHNIIKGLKHKRPDWTFGAATQEVKRMVFSSFLYLDAIFPLKADVLMIPITFNSHTLLTKRVLEHVKRRKKRIWVWLHEGKEVLTVNSQNQFLKLMDMGVDGVFTEFPEKLYDELNLGK